MFKQKLIHIPEPKLTFGYNQKLSDPRDGITLFGPFTRSKLVGQVNIGILVHMNKEVMLERIYKKFINPFLVQTLM